MLSKYFLRAPLQSVSVIIKRHKRAKCKSSVVPEAAPFTTQRSCLANGLVVATEETSSAMASVGLFVEAGARYEPPTINGISHFIEHMAYKGFMTMNKCAFEDFTYNLGAKFKAKATRDMFSLTADCFPESVEKVLNTFSCCLTELEVSEYNINLERKNIALELMDMEYDAKRLMFDYLHATAFQGTPLAQRVVGPSKNYEKFNRESVTNYMRQQFQPWRCVIAASGGVKHADLTEKAQAAFGNLPAMPVPETKYGPYRYTGSQVLYRDDSMPFAHIAIAVEAPGYASKDYLPMLVAGHIIGSWNKKQGGGEKNPSRLAQAAATYGLCESFESFYITYKETGLWGIYFVSKATDLDDMVYNIQDNWMNLCVTALASDWERGVNNCKLQLARMACGTSRSCRDIGRQMLLTCRRRTYVDWYQELCENTSIAEVKAAAEKYLYDQCPVVAGVGPVEGLPEYTRLRAGMYWLRL